MRDAVTGPVDTLSLRIARFLDENYRPTGHRLQLMVGLASSAADEGVFVAAADASVVAQELEPARRVARIQPRPRENTLRDDDVVYFLARFGHEYASAIFGADSGLSIPLITRAAGDAGIPVAFF
ncbi:hypothetical protein [Subtercola frigoramans]|uniref:Uncharacterized protein n=1 Tax=Subtercola frigoramans TaxID=120298 RepID=A0ABS2L7H7_9MICO|nr:hypothetical protein [Subtercola frigoramans]MBM7473027.1 hypothetical protein [Subtercola frigoramans]